MQLQAIAHLPSPMFVAASADFLLADSITKHSSGCTLSLRTARFIAKSDACKILSRSISAVEAKPTAQSTASAQIFSASSSLR
jgi:hypothetical protein